MDTVLIPAAGLNSLVVGNAEASSVLVSQLRTAAITPSISQSLDVFDGGLGNALWDKAGAVPTLDQDFATTKSLVDRISGQQLITFTRTTTGTYTNAAGVLTTAAINEPRFDHDPTTGESLGLLVEEQRANLLTYSEEMQNAAWSTTAASITADVTIAPNGTTTADKIVEDTTNSSHGVFRYPTITSNSTITGSVFLKKAERQYIRLTIGDAYGANSATARIDLAAGTVATVTSGSNPPTAVSAIITPLASGWFRVSITATLTGSSTNGFLGFNAVGGPTAWGSYTGNGTSGFFAWGAQLEAGAFPTSYIPTTTAAVTRSADVASISGSNFSSWFNAATGTLFTNASIGYTIPGTLFPLVGSLNDGSSINRIENGFLTSSLASFEVSTGAVTQAALYPVNSALARKLASSYAANDFATSVNGGAVSTDSSGTVPTVDRLFIGSRTGSGTTTLYGSVKRLTYWNQRLANAKLQSITS